MISQVKSVKITAQNLKSIVLDGSKKVQELEKKKQFTRERLEEKRLQEEEEKALEKRTKKILNICFNSSKKSFGEFN